MRKRNDGIEQHRQTNNLQASQGASNSATSNKHKAQEPAKPKEPNIFDSLSRNRDRKQEPPANKPKVMDSKLVAAVPAKTAKRNRKLPMIDFEEQDARHKRAQEE